MQGLKILVVEDEQIVALDLTQRLQRLGYQVPKPVAEGQQAIDAARRERPQLILMDVKLKGKMDGIEAARQITAQQAVPIVFLTAFGDSATLQRVDGIDVHGYLLKPFNENQLRVTIELARRRFEAEPQGETDRLAAPPAPPPVQLHEPHLELRRQVQARDSLLANVSHDLRNYLCVMQLNLEGLEQKNAPRRAHDSLVQGALRTAERMARLIGDLQDVSSLQSGALKVFPRPSHIRPIVMRAGRELSGVAAQAGCRLHLHTVAHADDRGFLGDAGRLLQVLHNLVSNAIKFAPNTDITVRGAYVDDAAIFSVSDGGAGIAAGQHQFIFERNTQSDTSKEGRGLGLYISRGIVEAHGGTLWAENDVPRGCTFYLRLPPPQPA